MDKLELDLIDLGMISAALKAYKHYMDDQPDKVDQLMRDRHRILTEDINKILVKAKVK